MTSDFLLDPGEEGPGRLLNFDLRWLIGGNRGIVTTDQGLGE
jgi:hypothetical protein